MAKEETLAPIAGDLPLPDGDDVEVDLFPNEMIRKKSFKLLLLSVQRITAFDNFYNNMIICFDLSDTNPDLKIHKYI